MIMGMSASAAGPADRRRAWFIPQENRRGEFSGAAAAASEYVKTTAREIDYNY